MRLIHTCNGFTLTMIGLAAIGVLALPASVQGQLLDNFNDGDDEGWTRFTHYWDPNDPNDPSHLIVPMWTVDPDPNPTEPNDFVYRLWIDGTATGSNILGSVFDESADPDYANGYWWTTVVRETEESSSVLVVRTDLELGSCYWLGYHPGCSGDVGLCIERIDFGSSGEILASDPDYWAEVGREYVLEAGAIGCRIELRMWPLGTPRPDTPQLAAMDCTYTSGVAGVAVQALGGGDPSVTFDDFCFAPSRPGDIDGDRDVDLADLARLLAAYDTCDGDPLYDQFSDLDCSGCVDLTDLATLLADYGYGT